MDILQTGFSQGEPSISNDDELAAQVAGFLEQFFEVFSELKAVMPDEADFVSPFRYC